MPKSDPHLLTQAEYARSRKARGLSGGSREAVRRAFDAKGISAFGPDKLVDPELADRQWEKNTRVRATTVPASAPKPGGEAGDLVDRAAGGEVAGDLPGEASTPTAPSDGGQLQADPGYQKSRARQAEA